MLSRRLEFLSSFYNHHQEIWDIGCDHGELGLSFVPYSSVIGIHLVDRSEKVIEQLRNTIKDSDIPRGKIEIYHSNGKNLKFKNKNKKIVFIAGMGGKEIETILVSLLSQLTSQDLLVLSPHRSFLELRQFLKKQGLRLLREKVISDGGTFYQVLAVALVPELPFISDFGHEMWLDQEGLALRQHYLEHFKLHQRPLEQAFYQYLLSIKT